MITSSTSWSTRISGFPTRARDSTSPRSNQANLLLQQSAPLPSVESIPAQANPGCTVDRRAVWCPGHVFPKLMFTPHERSCLRVKWLENHTQDHGRSQQVHTCRHVNETSHTTATTTATEFQNISTDTVRILSKKHKRKKKQQKTDNQPLKTQFDFLLTNLLVSTSFSFLFFFCFPFPLFFKTQL